MALDLGDPARRCRHESSAEHAESITEQAQHILTQIVVDIVPLAWCCHSEPHILGDMVSVRVTGRMFAYAAHFGCCRRCTSTLPNW
jgi:hypothetical protein